MNSGRPTVFRGETLNQDLCINNQYACYMNLGVSMLPGQPSLRSDRTESRDPRKMLLKTFRVFYLSLSTVSWTYE